MPTVLITGAARGLGLEFVKQYRAAGWDVIATARAESGELAETGAQIVKLDMTDFAAVAALKVDGPLDLLIANAGIALPAEAKSADDATAWLDTFRINSIAPVLLAQALMPQLAQTKGKAIAITSQMGSIADSSTAWIPYRASKAALNMAWHVLANEVRAQGVTLGLMHPGWVQTDMGGPGATIDAPTSVRGMVRVIGGLGIEQSGGFFGYDGREIPW
ncbi:MAG: SDR family oxidoreductase [Sphingomicrobium sp.]